MVTHQNMNNHPFYYYYYFRNIKPFIFLFLF